MVFLFVFVLPGNQERVVESEETHKKAEKCKKLNVLRTKEAYARARP